ncbi:PEPxxWA-CTERM sorting domain-containing protein [Sphingomonas sp. CL5.1]|uniref:PEPxxWA-CTERM sorting domain-containing protein n=1 Tax=Sphingomonas sp. CL5.1 TaxID=2653203 RepID=UPI0020C6BA69|nr:PEPxxWA-CTERM sorting domain-containing protein [Sphingomonas sp. CL5.1]
MMRKLVAAAALSAVSAIAMATPASAAIVFNLDNVKLVDGGTLTGSFTTSDDLSALEDFSITSAGGNGWPYGTFAGTTYTMANAISPVFWTFAQGISANFAGAQLNIFFSSPLTATGATLNQTSSETQTLAGSRWLTDGSVSAVAGGGSVPEPATWAMMIAGFGVVGAAMRRRKVRVRFA